MQQVKYQHPVTLYMHKQLGTRNLRKNRWQRKHCRGKPLQKDIKQYNIITLEARIVLAKGTLQKEHKIKQPCKRNIAKGNRAK